jgi:hypothetical protein
MSLLSFANSKKGEAMDKEELEKRMKQMNEKFERSFEAWRKKRNTAIKEVLNVLVDSDLTYEEAVNVLDGCRTYLRHNLKIENIDLNVEEREPF